MARLEIPTPVNHDVASIKRIVLMLVTGSGADYDTVIRKLVSLGFIATECETVISEMITAQEIVKTEDLKNKHEKTSK